MTSPREVIAWIYGCTDAGVVRRNNEDAFVIADLGSSLAAQSAPPTGSLAFDTSPQHGSEALFRKCVVGEQGLLLAVSDGMGGAEAGEVASFLVVESLRRDLAHAQAGRPTGRLVREAVERANNVVWGEAESSPRRTGMGATLTAVLIRENRAYVAGVGDSRAYVVREGRIRQVTRDQSLVESLVELGHITREQAETSPHRNVILQALGTRPNVAVALARLQLRRGDILLLCSDGLSGKLSADEMRDIALEGPTIDEAARAMVKHAKERGGEDNITVILAHFSGTGLASPVAEEAMATTIEQIHSFNHAAGAGYADDDIDTDTQPMEPVDDDAPTGPLAPAEGS
jgi:serine/threonine protein phosphatase PrpC